MIVVVLNSGYNTLCLPAGGERWCSGLVNMFTTNCFLSTNIQTAISGCRQIQRTKHCVSPFAGICSRCSTPTRVRPDDLRRSSTQKQQLCLIISFCMLITTNGDSLFIFFLSFDVIICCGFDLFPTYFPYLCF